MLGRASRPWGWLYLASSRPPYPSPPTLQLGPVLPLPCQGEILARERSTQRTGWTRDTLKSPSLLEEEAVSANHLGKKKPGSQEWWQASLIPAIREAEAENRLTPGGGGCSEPRSSHCDPAWATEPESVLKK